MKIQSVEIAQWLLNEGFFDWVDEKVLSKSKNKDKYTSVKDMYVKEITKNKVSLFNSNKDGNGIMVDAPAYSDIWNWLSSIGVYIQISSLLSPNTWIWVLQTKDDPTFEKVSDMFDSPEAALIDGIQYIKNNCTAE